MPACSSGHTMSGTQISEVQASPSAHSLPRRHPQPNSPKGQALLVELEPSTWPVELTVVPPVVLLPLDVPVELSPLSVPEPVDEDRSEGPLLVVQVSPEVSGGPIGSTDPHPATSTRISVRRIGGMVAGTL